MSPWQCPSLAPTPLRGAPDGSGRLVTPRERPHHWPSSHCLGCSSKPPPKPPISPPLTIQAQTAGPGRWVCSYAGELLNLSQLLTRYAASKPTYVYRLSGSLSTGCSKLAPGADLIPRFPCAEGTCRGYLRRRWRSLAVVFGLGLWLEPLACIGPLGLPGLLGLITCHSAAWPRHSGMAPLGPISVSTSLATRCTQACPPPQRWASRRATSCPCRARSRRYVLILAE